MVGSSSPSKRYFSSITAALFADSGWYTVNEKLVEPLVWGYKKGCDFIERSCSEWPPEYICTRSGATQCSYDRLGEAYCEITTHEKLLPHNQRYFGEDRNHAARLKPCTHAPCAAAACVL